MMSKLEDKVNEILGVETKAPVQQKEFKPLVPRMEDKNKEDVDNDYKYSRENYYNLIEKGQEAIQGILDIAQEGQHPRAYEVAGQLIGQVGQTVDKLQDLQKKLKDLKEVPNKTNANIKNALFVGSTAELQKMLKQNNEDTKSKNITPEETDISDK
jgi:methylmalonyl-CoA mutase N-terminal domain/subunit